MDAHSEVHGVCDPGFEPIRTCFEANFREHAEVGAALAVHVDGRCVVNLWGGLADRSQRVAWTQDTLVNAYSTTKGLAALCIAHLVEQGALDLDARVSRYWPEFAAAGKERIDLRELLSHRAGLAALDERLPSAALYDHPTMARALAAAAPGWPQRTHHGYHAQTFGFLLGELVRRVTDTTLGGYLRAQLAGPLNADVFIGLPAEYDARVAKLTRPLGQHAPPGEVDLMRVWKLEPDSLTARAFNNPPPLPGATQTRAYRAAELPSSNGHASALGLSRIYGAVVAAGRGGLARLFSPESVARCHEQYAVGPDLVLRTNTRFGPGFMLSQAEGSGRFGPNPHSFGHPGMGGSLGFADPDARIGFGYVMNRAGASILVDHRPQRLIDALYGCI